MDLNGSPLSLTLSRAMSFWQYQSHQELYEPVQLPIYINSHTLRTERFSKPSSKASTTVLPNCKSTSRTSFVKVIPLLTYTICPRLSKL